MRNKNYKIFRGTNSYTNITNYILSFILRNKSARPGRNPKTGEDVEISPRRVVTFKAGQKFKVRVEGNVAS